MNETSTVATQATHQATEQADLAAHMKDALSQFKVDNGDSMPSRSRRALRG